MKSITDKIKKHIPIGFYFGSNAYEIANFFCGIGEAEILESSIKITNYPFEPSAVYPEKEIKHHEIAEIHVEKFPPTLKISDELIFISRNFVDELEIFANRNNVKKADCSSNWDWISEPFLDTEFDEEQKLRSLEILAENGIAEKEVLQLREEIGKQMYKYNFDTMLWEWGNLGLTDVLSAMRVKLSEKEFEEFYWRAMEIEQRH